MYDILIKNGTVVDGTGEASYKADVAVKDGKIAKISANIDEAAAKTIDAAGRLVTPGFIDLHSHSDVYVIFGTDAHNFLQQGITTEIAGHCGVSPAPSMLAHKSTYKEVAELVTEEEFNKISEDCSTIAGYTKHMESMKLGTNMALFVGQGAIRGRVMESSDGKPNEKQLEAMRALVREAMEHGFLGISTGLIYPPSVYADEDEIVELAKEAAKYGGIYASHIRGESDTVIDAVTEAISVGERSGCSVLISHHKVAGPQNLGKSAVTLKLIDEANARGVNVRADQYPYLAGATDLISSLPPQFATGGRPALIENLKKPEFRAEVTAVLEADNFGESLLKNSTFKGCLILAAANTPELIGKNIAEVAELRGSDPYETVYDVLVENNGAVGMAYFMINEADMDAIIAHDLIMPGTDAAHRTKKVDLEQVGGGHPRSTGTFPKHLRLIRERKLFSVEKAIYRATGMAAETAKIDGVGYLKEGLAADICILDWENIAETSDFLHPFRPNKGFDYVLVNGRIAVENDVATGVLAGKLLKMRKGN